VNASSKCFTWSERSRLFTKHVINVHLQCACDSLLENFIDHPLESGSGIFQAKGHDFVAVDDTASGKGCLVLICWMHLNLVVFRANIHEAEESVTRYRINHLIYCWAMRSYLWGKPS